MTVLMTAAAKFYVSTTAAAETVDTETEYEALTYTEVTQVETLGDLGDQYNVVTPSFLGDTRVRKALGARDAGTLEISVGYDPADSGQTAMVTASNARERKAFKITCGPTQEFFFCGFVSSIRLTTGGNDNVIRRQFQVAIDSAVLEATA